MYLELEIGQAGSGKLVVIDTSHITYLEGEGAHTTIHFVGEGLGAPGLRVNCPMAALVSRITEGGPGCGKLDTDGSVPPEDQPGIHPIGR